MDAGWTPGGRGQTKRAGKGTIDGLLGDLLEDDVQPKKKSVSQAAGRNTYGSKKQSSKDEDFYSSLAQAADEDDKMSDVSEADVNQMAKSIADLDDLDANLFHTGGTTTTKAPKRGSLKEKSSKPNTPRRTGTPRSRSVTPRASSPPLRMSPANRVTSPTGRVTSPNGRGVSPTVNREANSSPVSFSLNRSANANKKPVQVPTSGSSHPPTLPEYKPSTAPGKLSDIRGSASANLKPGSMSKEVERPRTVPKAKSFDFGEFDEDDPLAGIPMSDDEDDFGLGPKSRFGNKQQKEELTSARSAPVLTQETIPTKATKEQTDSGQQRNLFDRPPTRSGNNTGVSEEDPSSVSATQAASTTQVNTPTPAPTAAAVKQKPAVVKKSDELVFSDDDDFLGGLGIEEKNTPVKPKVKVKVKPTEIEDEESLPAKSALDKLLNSQSVSKHLETKEKREFVLDSKYTKSQQPEEEEDFQFGSYMPSAAASNSSRPTSKRSVRFQDDDDIFGINDNLSPRTRSPPSKKPEMDWLEMATGGKAAKTTAPKPEEPKPDPPKPKSAPSDWLGLTGADNDDADSFDLLKESSFSASARLGQSTSKPIKTDQEMMRDTASDPGKSQKTKPVAMSSSAEKVKPVEDQKFKVTGAGAAVEPKGSQSGINDYLGLGEEIDPSKLLRSKSQSPVFGDGFAKQTVKDDIFQTPPIQTAATEQTRGRTMFQSAARHPMSMSPRKESPNDSPRRSPERKVNIEEPAETASVPLMSQLQRMQQSDTTPQPQPTRDSHPPQSTAAPEAGQSSTNFFSFKRDDLKKRQKDQTSALQAVPQSQGPQSQMSVDETDARPSYPSGHPSISQVASQYNTQPASMSYTSDTPQQFSSLPMSQVNQSPYQQMKYSQSRGVSPQVQQQQQYQQQYQQQQQQQQQPQMMYYQPPPQMISMAERPLFTDNVDVDVQAKIRRLEVELEYARDILSSTKRRYEEEIMALETSYKGRLQLMDETHHKREQRWREEQESMLSQHLKKLQQSETDKSAQINSHYNKLEEFEQEKSQDIERLKDIHRQALDTMKKDHEESLLRLKRSKDQQIDVAASSHETSRSMMAAVSLIENNAKDLGALQKKMDSWHSQGLDEREINARSKDEQLRILGDRLNKQQEDNDTERQKLQELIARLEAQIREQTRMLEEERWKVKQEQGRLQALQTSLEEERRVWGEQQARERVVNEKARDALLEEQRSTLQQLHKERQALSEEQIQFNVSQKMAREDHAQMSIKASQARAEYEALTKAISEGKDRLEMLKSDIQKEEEKILSERRRLDKEQDKMESKEAELMQAAAMMQGRSEEIEEMYSMSQHKYEEGMAALKEAQRIEAEEANRIDTANTQLSTLRLKDREMAEERLRLSREKRDAEKFRSSLLCPNCRNPTRMVTNGNMTFSPQNINNGGLLMMSNNNEPPSNGFLNNSWPGPSGLVSPPAYPYNPNLTSPLTQLSINTVDAVTESIKSDRAIRKLKMDALKDQKYLEEQSMFLYSLKHMPYSSPKG